MRWLWVAAVTACYAPHPPQGAPCVDTSRCPADQICVTGACRLPGQDAAIDTSLAIDAPAVPRSCRDIHIANPTAPSGAYTIKPGAISIQVQCDMATAGGGWTIVFVAASPNLTSPPLAYDVAAPALLTSSVDALIAYRDASLAALEGAATFALPMAWRIKPPFAYDAIDAPVITSVNGGAPVAGTLHYGTQDFASVCGDAWFGAGTSFGRLCVDGTAAPFYSGYATTAGDFCSNSAAAYSTTSCSSSTRFSIAVR